MKSDTDSIRYTPRELEILFLIAEGFTVKEIAKLLHITDATVVGHKTNLMSKMEARNIAELIYKSFIKGIL